MLEATQMVYETYRQMLLEYEAAHIAILVFPSGAGAKYTMHIEPGMCHCYPMLTFFPEGKRAYEEITALLF